MGCNSASVACLPHQAAVPEAAAAVALEAVTGSALASAAAFGPCLCQLASQLPGVCPMRQSWSMGCGLARLGLKCCADVGSLCPLTAGAADHLQEAVPAQDVVQGDVL